MDTSALPSMATPVPAPGAAASPQTVPSRIEGVSAAGQSQRSARLAGVEWVRIIACLGIAWFHMGGPGGAIGYGGLPAFVAVAVALAAAPARPTAWQATVSGRFQRLLVPWVFWSAVYGLAKVCQALLQHHSVAGEFEPWMLLTGTTVHLWFLPFAFCVTVIVRVLAGKGLLSLQGPVWIGYAAAAGLLILPCSWLIEGPCAFYPAAQWMFALPAVFAGLALAAEPDRTSARTRSAGVALATGIGCAIAALSGWRGMVLPYLAGMTGCSLGWAVRSPASPRLVQVAGLSFAFYLVHPLVGRMLLAAMPSLSGVSLAVPVCVISAVAAWGIVSSRLRRFA